jgi:hypothetical protein
MLTLLREAKAMDSSANQSGSLSNEPSAERAVPSVSDTLHASDGHGAEPAKADADVTAPVTAADSTSDTVKSEAGKTEASQGPEEPVKAEATRPSSELVRAEPNTGSEIASANLRPGSALVAFVPAAERFEPHRETSEAPHAAADTGRGRSRLVLYGSQVAALALLLGCGYVAGGQLLHGNGPAKPEASALASSAAASATAAPAALSAEAVERAELRHRTQELAEEIHILKTSLDQLRNSVAQSQSSEEIHSLKKGLDGVKSGLEASKTETNASIAQLTAKLDHMQREQVAKLQQMLEKAERFEPRPNNAPLTTGSIPAVQANASPSKLQQSAALLPPASAAGAEAQKKMPQSISNWVVRDVYDGIALVEGPGGAFEVMQGENIPGLGTVKSIERRGGGWVVVTSRGNVEYARD